MIEIPQSESRCGDLILVCGLPCSGKSTAIQNALKHNSELLYMKSYTTRPRRPGEGDDEYFFVDDNGFEQKKSSVPPEHWEESETYDRRYGQDTHFYNQQMELGRFVIGCCYPSLAEVESLSPYYETTRTKVIFIDIDERVRRERMLQTRGSEAIKRLKYDAEWSAAPDFLARTDYTITPRNHLEYDLAAFDGVVKQIMSRE